MIITRVIIGSHLLAFPSSLAPNPPWCWQTRSHLAVESWLTPGYIVLAASHPAITHGAWASRLLPTGQQVWLENFIPPDNQQHDFHIALHKIHYHLILCLFPASFIKFAESTTENPSTLSWAITLCPVTQRGVNHSMFRITEALHGNKFTMKFVG